MNCMCSVISFDFALPRYAQDERKGDRRFFSSPL